MKKILINKCLWYLIATGFGSGLLSKVFPGTLGSIVAIMLWLFIVNISRLVLWIFIIIGFCIGCMICQQKYNKIKVYDHGSIVWDEFIGMWVTLMAIPCVNIKWLFIAFFIFRLFDILKPWPIYIFDKNINGGFNVMIDDIIAAIFSYIIICVISFIKRDF
ncbi:Phosphatidylglycerophosphatase A [Candidatus Providencia siddallii]|uniref:Phosphatidylglycerophosphatase A n=1 Tax=Candidatus Providencia siddallii TaxID=1715285 RepID=A0A0M6W826_9GAMM|nr:Phosphatidylglycerophosphatase A [Candidatus Providencia siddallii]